MPIYVDSNIVIYAVEAPVAFGPKALARLQAISTTDKIAVSDLTRMECCSLPLRQGNFGLLRLYDAYFQRHDVMVVPIASATFRRATLIKAMNGFGTVDSIHLAIAVENGCRTFLPHDFRLGNFADVTVEVLV